MSQADQTKAAAGQAQGEAPPEVVDLTGVAAADVQPVSEGSGAVVPVPVPVPTHADPAQRRRLMPWAIVTGVATLLSVGAIGSTYTPLFDAKHVTVSGTHHLNETQVLHVAGVGQGTNLIHADLGNAERRLERNPWVADASVSRHLPSALVVTVVERVPVATVPDGAGGSLLLAADGRRLGVAKGNAVAYPVVGTTDPSAIPPPGIAAEGGTVSAAMSPPLRAQVAQIVIGADRSILVQTRDGVTVTYGDDTDLVAKAQDLKAVLDYGAANGIAYSAIDVSVPGAPTARRVGVVNPVSVPAH